MNILSQIPFLNSKDVESEVDPAEAKRERIKFHRNRVRNGPVKFTTQTSGQARRERHRALDRQTKKARRAQIRTYFAEQREAATLRGLLQTVGLVSYVDTGREIDSNAACRAVVEIMRRFAKPDKDGNVEVTDKSVRAALQAALNRWQKLTGQPTTKIPA